LNAGIGLEKAQREKKKGQLNSQRGGKGEHVGAALREIQLGVSKEGKWIFKKKLQVRDYRRKKKKVATISPICDRGERTPPVLALGEKPTLGHRQQPQLPRLGEKKQGTSEKPLPEEEPL